MNGIHAETFKRKRSKALALLCLSLLLGAACAWWADGYTPGLALLTIAVIGLKSLLGVSLLNDLAADERITRLAYHDDLTGLPNRMALEDRIRQAISQAERRHQHVAVMFLDLDRFKWVNDSLGHAAGDNLLVEVARRLSGVVRKVDTVTRQGGDEFIVLLDGLRETTDAATVAAKILQTLSQPYRLEGQDVRIGASVGISLFPQDARDPTSLLKYADTAMYHAKERGRDTFQFYTATLGRSAKRRLSLQHDLVQAMERDQLVLYYQPRMETAGGRISAWEALIRWRHPRRGLLLPRVFMPVAEEAGLVDAINAWALYTACAQTQQWRREGLEIPRIVVNLATIQWRSRDLPDTVCRVLRQTALEASCLELDLTETMLMPMQEDMDASLRTLREMGVNLAVDDFGVGYSSVQHLKRLPFDRLKIDTSLTSGLGRDADALAIVTAIVELAHTLQLRVVAEGVETPEQHSLLKQLACDEMQGYHFCRPVTADQVPTLSAWALFPHLPRRISSSW